MKKNKYKHRNWLHFFSVFAFVALVFVSLLNFIAMPIITHQGRERTLINVVGTSWDEAISLLRREGFEPVRGETKEDTTAPYTIIAQSPGAGHKVKQGRRVYLTISIPHEKQPFPNLIGKTLRGAQIEIDKYQMVLDTVLWEYSNRPKDVIIAQIPEPNEKVAFGTPVRLTVSLGITKNYVVPEVVFLLENEAIKEIKKSGLDVGIITYEPTDSIAPYTVLEQGLPAGQKIYSRQKIDLVISRLP